MTTMRLAMAACLLSAGAAAADLKQIHVPIGRDGSNVTLYLYAFDTRRVALKIIDQGRLDNQPFKNLDAAMLAYDCLAGCNGGFFGRNGEPVGLVVADGQVSGARNRISELAAGVLFQDGGGMRIQRAGKYFANGASKTQHLLQAGPFLVEDGKPVAGLSTRKHARRTFIVTDGENRWAIGYAPATTLAILGAILADPEHFTPFKVRTALNLDGGASSAIWVKRDEHHPLYLRELHPVRNFVGLVPR